MRRVLLQVVLLAVIGPASVCRQAMCVMGTVTAAAPGLSIRVAPMGLRLKIVRVQWTAFTHLLDPASTFTFFF